MADFSVAAFEDQISKTWADKPGELGLEQCRDMYLQEIFDWTDYWMENWSNDMSGDESKEFVVSKLVELWKSYAFFEAKNKQFKKAVEVFKKAVEDPVVGVTSNIFEVYAEYYLEKNKPASAQKVLIEGLCKQSLSKVETKLLWEYMLEFTKKLSGKNDLSMKQLYEEIVTAGIELNQTLSFPPDCDAEELMAVKVQRTVPKNAHIVDVAETKVAEHTESMPAVEPYTVKVEPSAVPVSTVPVPAPAISVPTIANKAAESSGSLPPSIHWFEDNTFSKTQPISSISTSLATVWTGEQILLVFQRAPPSLFCSPAHEHIVEGIRNLSSEEKYDIETFLTTSVSSDAEKNGHAKNMLDIIEAMWCQQGLRERHFDAWVTLLSHAQRREEFAVTSAQYQNAAEAKAAENQLHARQERTQQLLLAYLNKCRYDLLLEQLGILTTLKLHRCTSLILQQLEQWGMSNKKNAVAFLQQPLQQAKDPRLFQVDDYGILRQECVRISKLLGCLLSLRANFLLAQGRISAPTLMALMSQHPAYSLTTTNSAAASSSSSTAATSSLSSTLLLAGIKREVSTTSDETATSPGGSQRRKSKRRRTLSAGGVGGGHGDSGIGVPVLSLSHATTNGGAFVNGGGSYDGAATNSYNMPAQMTLSDVARERIFFQQQQSGLFR